MSAGELQQTFDRTFAEAPRADATPQEDLLAITIGGDPYAMRLSEVAGLYPDRRITWLPGSVPALLGLVGLRGALLPVYDLRTLLGYPKAATRRWLAVMADGQVALGFEQFDNHLRVPRSAIAETGTGSATGRPQPVREVAHTDGLVRPIIHLPSVLEAIAVMAHHAARPKE
ncbi:MAG: chemotaxis protein CheW [Acidobacteria bacterium]|nr:chemotaxis protein CheW [Acidobacteriota bacterium]